MPELIQPARELKQLIEYNGYRNDRTLAGFLKRKGNLIKLLIPNNSAYENQLQNLETAMQQAEAILQS